MPVSAGDLTVKKYDGTTDVVYTLLTAAAGDRTPAAWRNNSASGTIGQKPTFTMTSRSAGNGTARAIDFVFRWPSVYTDTTGVTRVRSTGQFKGTFVMPLDATDVDLQEAAAQCLHLLAHGGTVEVCKTGYAPT